MAVGLYFTALQGFHSSIFWSFSILEKYIGRSKAECFWTLHIGIAPGSVIQVNVTQCRPQKNPTKPKKTKTKHIPVDYFFLSLHFVPLASFPLLPITNVMCHTAEKTS